MRNMHTYRLKFSDSMNRRIPDIEFEAEDAFGALTMAHEKARNASAELWQDGRKVCSIRRVGGELWEVGPGELFFEDGP